MTIATDIAAFNSATAASMTAIENQILVLETDFASNKQTFGTSSGPQAAGNLFARMTAAQLRLNNMIYDNR